MPSAVSADISETWTYYAGTGAATAMKADGDIVWCGTEFGLVRWNTRDMSYHIYRVPDGLPHAHIMDIAMAPNGEVWVTTEKGGIARFDDSSWETHSANNGLPYNYGLSVEIDDENSVWVSVYRPDYVSVGGGLSRWDGVSWQTFMYNEDVQYSSENIIYDFVLHSDGAIWGVCDYGRSLINYIDGVWTRIDFSHVRNVILGADSIVWLTTYNGLYRLEDGDVLQIDLPDGLEIGQACEPVAGPDDDLWIVDREGRVVVITDNTPLLVNGKGNRNLSLQTITCGDDGTLYGGTDDGSLAVFEGTEWKIYPTVEQNIIVNQIIEDNAENLWAYGEAGIYKFDGESWTIVFNSDDLPDLDEYYSIKIYVDNGGGVWIFNNQDVFYHDGEWVNPEAFLAAPFYSQIVASNNMICFSYNYKEVSLYSIENETVTYLSLPETFHPDENLSVTPHVIDRSGTLWITASKEGPWMYLLSYKDGVWSEYPSIERETNYDNRVLTGIEFGDDGSVFLATVWYVGGNYPVFEGYIYKKEFGSDIFNKVISRGKVLDLRAVDRSGRAWISTSVWDQRVDLGYHYDGVIQYDDKNMRTITELDGLPSNNVYDIYADHNNAIWIATEKGLCRYGGDITTGVDEEEASPSPIPLITASPNPFNPMTTVSFTLPKEGFTTMTVYNIAGQKVATLVSDDLTSGTHSVVWDGRDTSGTVVASGIYIMRLVSGKHTATAKLALVR